MPKARSVVPLERIERTILVVHGQKVMLDVELAAGYGVETRALVQAVKRNPDRFPPDSMFQLSRDASEACLKSQSVTSKGRGRRGPRPSAAASVAGGKGNARLSVGGAMRALGLEPRTHGLKGRCSTD